MLRFAARRLVYHLPRSTCSAAKLSTHLRSRKPAVSQWVLRRPECGFSHIRLLSDYPDHFRIDMPALSPTMESGTIVSWSVAEGDELGEGDLLAQIETDKATMDFEAPEVGFLAKILVPAGTPDVKLGTPVCIIVENKEDIGSFSNFVAEAAPTPPAPTPAAAPPAPTPPPAEVARIMASPMARSLAARKGIDLSAIRGSGADGVIRASDVEAAQAPGTVAPAVVTPAEVTPPVVTPAVVTPTLVGDGAYTEIPLTSMRKAIAKRLTHSTQTIPQYFLTVEVTLDSLLSVRGDLNKEAAADNVKLSVTDFLIKACSKALLDVPEVNSQWDENSIKQFHNADISVAVATDTGLITPIVHTANNKGLKQINSELGLLKEKAVTGKLQPHEFQGGTFTISNLGMMGVQEFTAVINPPQSCILAVGAPNKKLIPSDNESGYEKVTVMNVSLTCDHRVVDGAVGAKWLQSFKSYMEKPLNLLL